MAAPNDPEEPESEDESESSYDSEDDSSFDSDMEGEAQRLIAALQDGSMAPNPAPQVPQKTPQEKWTEFVEGIETCTNASLKVTDELVSWVKDIANEEERL